MDEATQFLETVQIPKIAKALDEQELSIVAIQSSLQNNGINMRYLGLVRYHCKAMEARILLLTEMIARTMKNRVWRKWRNSKEGEELQAKKIVAEEINLILGNYVIDYQPVR